MTQDLTHTQPPTYLPVRFWLVLHPVTLFLVLTWVIVCLVHCLGVFNTDFRDEWPIAAAFFMGLVAYAFWKKLRGRRTEYIATLVGGAFLLYLDAMNWLSLLLGTRYRDKGTFGLLVAFVVTGLVADTLFKRIYLKALNPSQPPVLARPAA